MIKISTGWIPIVSMFRPKPSITGLALSSFLMAVILGLIYIAPTVALSNERRCNDRVITSTQAFKKCGRWFLFHKMLVGDF